MRGRRILVLEPSKLALLLRGRFQYGGTSLPGDVAVEHVAWDELHQVMRITLSSTEWGAFPEGSVLPWVQVATHLSAIAPERVN